MKRVIQFLKKEDGISAVEYGLLASLIAAVIILSLQTVGTNLNTLFNNIAASL